MKSLQFLHKKPFFIRYDCCDGDDPEDECLHSHCSRGHINNLPDSYNYTHTPASYRYNWYPNQVEIMRLKLRIVWGVLPITLFHLLLGTPFTFQWRDPDHLQIRMVTKETRHWLSWQVYQKASKGCWKEGPNVIRIGKDPFNSALLVIGLVHFTV